jgi:hypothetical protein
MNINDIDGIAFTRGPGECHLPSCVQKKNKVYTFKALADVLVLDQTLQRPSLQL